MSFDDFFHQISRLHIRDYQSLIITFFGILPEFFFISFLRFERKLILTIGKTDWKSRDAWKSRKDKMEIQSSSISTSRSKSVKFFIFQVFTRQFFKTLFPPAFIFVIFNPLNMQASDYEYLIVWKIGPVRAHERQVQYFVFQIY